MIFVPENLSHPHATENCGACVHKDDPYYQVEKLVNPLEHVLGSVWSTIWINAAGARPRNARLDLVKHRWRAHELLTR